MMLSVFSLLVISLDTFAVEAEAPAVIDSAVIDSAVTASVHTSLKASESVSMGYMGQLVIGMLIVLLCIVVLAWFAKRFTRLQSGTNGNMQILGGLSLGSRERIVLVQVGSEQILLGVAPGRVNTLCELNEPVSTTNNNPVSNNGSFAEKLVTAISRRPL